MNKIFERLKQNQVWLMVVITNRFNNPYFYPTIQFTSNNHFTIRALKFISRFQQKSKNATRLFAEKSYGPFGFWSTKTSQFNDGAYYMPDRLHIICYIWYVTYHMPFRSVPKYQGPLEFNLVLLNRFWSVGLWFCQSAHQYDCFEISSFVAQ